MNILEEALDITLGVKEEDYGDPYDDYLKVAKLWSVVLGCKVNPAQAALCMLMIKVSREIHCPKRDNRVDMAGYASVIDRICERMEQEEV